MAKRNKKSIDSINRDPVQILQDECAEAERRIDQPRQRRLRQLIHALEAVDKEGSTTKYDYPLINRARKLIGELAMSVASNEELHDTMGLRNWFGIAHAAFAAVNRSPELALVTHLMNMLRSPGEITEKFVEVGLALDVLPHTESGVRPAAERFLARWCRHTMAGSMSAPPEAYAVIHPILCKLEALLSASWPEMRKISKRLTVQTGAASSDVRGAVGISSKAATSAARDDELEERLDQMGMEGFYGIQIGPSLDNYQALHTLLKEVRRAGFSRIDVAKVQCVLAFSCVKMEKVDEARILMSEVDSVVSADNFESVCIDAPVILLDVACLLFGIGEICRGEHHLSRLLEMPDRQCDGNYSLCVNVFSLLHDFYVKLSRKEAADKAICRAVDIALRDCRPGGYHRLKALERWLVWLSSAGRCPEADKVTVQFAIECQFGDQVQEQIMEYFSSGLSYSQLVERMANGCDYECEAASQLLAARIRLTPLLTQDEIAKLIALLRDVPNYRRECAAIVLRAAAGGATDAMPELTRLLSDPCASVARLASVSIESIRRGGRPERLIRHRLLHYGLRNFFVVVDGAARVG